MLRSIVFAAIAPHGSLAIPNARGPEEKGKGDATAAGMEELGRRFAAARPEAVVVFTPHNVHVEGALAVVVSGKAAGDLAQWGGPQVRLEGPLDRELAIAVKEAIRNSGLPVVGISFGGNDPAMAVHPMDWAVLIPYWYLGGRSQPQVPLVIISPCRDLGPQEHVRAGRAVASAAASSGRRVALVASADHGHGHDAAGPYGIRPESRAYDDRVVEIVRSGRLERLLELDADWVNAAAADSWWQMLMLHGALGDGLRADLLSYEAPTYYGMLTAAFEVS